LPRRPGSILRLDFEDRIPLSLRCRKKENAAQGVPGNRLRVEAGRNVKCFGRLCCPDGPEENLLRSRRIRRHESHERTGWETSESITRTPPGRRICTTAEGEGATEGSGASNTEPSASAGNAAMSSRARRIIRPFSALFRKKHSPSANSQKAQGPGHETPRGRLILPPDTQTVDMALAALPGDCLPARPRFRCQ